MVTTTRRNLIATAATLTVLTVATGCIPMPPPIDSIPRPNPTAAPDSPTPHPGKPLDTAKPAPSNPNTTPTPAGNIEEACLQLFNSWYQFTPNLNELDYTTDNPIAEATTGTDITCTITITNLGEFATSPEDAGIDSLTVSLITSPTPQLETQVTTWAENEGLTPFPGGSEQVWQGFLPEEQANTPAPEDNDNWTYGRALSLTSPALDDQDQAITLFEEATGVIIEEDSQFLLYGEGWFPTP